MYVCSCPTVILQAQSLPLPIQLKPISQQAHFQCTENSATKYNHQFKCLLLAVFNKMVLVTTSSHQSGHLLMLTEQHWMPWCCGLKWAILYQAQKNWHILRCMGGSWFKTQYRNQLFWHVTIFLSLSLQNGGKKLQVAFTLQVNLADHGYVLAHTYTYRTYLFA
jgi:hypothetical protein